MKQNKTAAFVALHSLSIYCLLSFSTSLTLAAYQNPSETAEQLIAKANNLLINNKYGDAKKEVKKALNLNPNSAMANLLMAVIYKHDGKRKDAIKYVQKALNAEPTNFHAHYLMAVLFYETLQSGKAREEINLAITQGAQFANAYSLKGDLDIEERNYESALSYFEKALTLSLTNKNKSDDLQQKVDSLKNYLEFRKANKTGAEYTRPVPLNTPRPDYTEEARNNRVQGAIRMQVLVTGHGKVQSWILLTRLGYGLDEEAIKAVQKLQFKPATYNGNPIYFWVTVEVGFTLK